MSIFLLTAITLSTTYSTCQIMFYPQQRLCWSPMAFKRKISWSVMLSKCIVIQGCQFHCWELAPVMLLRELSGKQQHWKENQTSTESTPLLLVFFNMCWLHCLLTRRLLLLKVFSTPISLFSLQLR